MTPSRRSRHPHWKMKTIKINDSRLGTYLTLGVGAGVLGSQSSHAAIVYWDVTPITVTAPVQVWLDPLTGASGTGGFTPGTPIFGLRFLSSNYIYSLTDPNNAAITAIAHTPGDVMSRFAGGDEVGPTLTFKANWSYMDRVGWTTSDSPWATGADGTSGFIGFRFDNAGTPYYGWIEVTYNDASQSLAWGDFAYEDSGAGILAGAVPEPSSLALLVLGASGVIARRRRQAA